MRVLVLGAGTIGATIAGMLAGTDSYAVTLADARPEALERIRRNDISLRALDVEDRAALETALAKQDAVVSALPFFLNTGIAEAARAAEAHYFDLTEDVATTAAVRAVAADARTAFVPQCGLAPGFVGIVAHALTRRFERVRAVRLRVGALPRYTTNPLKYNLTWSTEGLINEYCNPCEAIRHGKRTLVPPLQGLERFSFDGIDYEAFNTSGGLGTLTETLEGKVESLDYKTVRYPGHRDIMELLLDGLRLRERRELLVELLQTALPTTAQDVVLVFVSIVGTREGRLVEETFARKIHGGEAGQTLSAIQQTTAAGLCAMVELLRRGHLPQKGFVPQEAADLGDFLATPFAEVFRSGSGAEFP
jgi:saccharopine dehydrogenase (NAD+, L-lysine-forming)